MPTLRDLAEPALEFSGTAMSTPMTAAPPTRNPVSTASSLLIATASFVNAV
jgi:hypothetical protein